MCHWKRTYSVAKNKVCRAGKTMPWCLKRVGIVGSQKNRTMFPCCGEIQNQNPLQGRELVVATRAAPLVTVRTVKRPIGWVQQESTWRREISTPVTYRDAVSVCFSLFYLEKNHNKQFLSKCKVDVDLKVCACFANSIFPCVWRERFKSVMYHKRL